MDHVNELKDKNHIDHPTDAEKKLMQNSTSIYDKTINKVGLEGIWFNIILTTHDKTRANILLNGKKLKAFPWRSETRQRCPLLTILFNIVLEVLATANSQEKETKPSRLKIKSKTVSICRLHGIIYRKPWRLHQNTIRTNNHIQSYRIQIQSIKISGIFIHYYELSENLRKQYHL